MTSTKPSAHADICCTEGWLDGTEALLVSANSRNGHSPAALKTIIARFKVSTLIHIDSAYPIVPYLQHGDMVVADSLIVCHFDGPSGFGRYSPVADDGSKSSLDRTLMLQVMKAYETLFSGRSNRPQLIQGRVVTTEDWTTDKKALAKLQRILGGMAVDRNGAMVENLCRTNDIPLLLMRVIIDLDEEEHHPDLNSGLKLVPDQVTDLIVQTIATPQTVPVFS
jgi:nucleoside phosphorylase